MLVIDECDQNRSAAARILRTAGYSVWELPSAIGATRLAMRFQIDAVIIGVSGSDRSGERVATVLRRNSHLANIAIIVLSEKTQSELDDTEQSSVIDGAIAPSDVSEYLVTVLTRAFTKRIRGPASRRIPRY